jgi:hypothetical protein
MRVSQLEGVMTELTTGRLRGGARWGFGYASEPARRLARWARVLSEFGTLG